MPSDKREIKNTSIDELIPYVRNARTHSDSQVAQIAASIKEFGWTNPILIDGDKGIIAGHGRLLAARKLGMDKVPVIELSHLSETQKKAYIIADNKLSLNAGWDDELLGIELEELKGDGFDLSLTGFDDTELSDLTLEEKTGLTDEDEVPEVPEIPVARLSDIWTLGNHRLMCGDSTDKESVELLMDGQKADMVFTDPPYGINYSGIKDKRKVKNDNLADREFIDFLSKSITGCETMYVCCSWQNSHLFREFLERIARKPKAMIVWDKVNPAQHLDKYFKQHEIIFYYGDFGGHKTIRGDVWRLERQRNAVHPTMKPVELIEIALKDQQNCSNVIDVFGGSGSTLIAAEKNNRIAYLMELDPKYCDVIINRWQDYTGQEAKLNNKTYEEVKHDRLNS